MRIKLLATDSQAAIQEAQDLWRRSVGVVDATVIAESHGFYVDLIR